MSIVNIEKIAERLGIDRRYLIPYGRFIAKVDLRILDKIANRRRGKYILVTAMTPTPFGEGKTVTTIGLSMALNRLGKMSTVCLRQPSLGPVFGIKGGGTGGGSSCVLPAEDINLHFTGDAHAVTSAHNLASAFLDNVIYRGNHLNINTSMIYWRRVMDVNDRSLRDLGRGFDMTSASELMAILSLSRDLSDLRCRVSRIVIGGTADDVPVTADDLKVAGSMAALLKDAIKPNLVQTIENTPCLAHTGPFGNIAHGSGSIISDEIALAFSDYVVTEAGFGADLGAEKFFDIKCRTSGFIPDAAVLVCSVRAVKAHSGMFGNIRSRAGNPLYNENSEAAAKGLCNLKKQIENTKIFGVPVVVAINRFDTDTEAEIKLIKDKAVEFGADYCEVSNAWRQGSKGAVDLAKSVIKAAKTENKFRFLYPLTVSIKEKIKAIAVNIYGAADVSYSASAEEKIRIYNQAGWSNLPICMAKTQFSLSHDPNLKGSPEGFVLPIRDIRPAIGAGFLYPLCADIQTMPGLPVCPRGETIDINEKGDIIGVC